MDYDSGICTVTNTITGANKEIRISERGFKLPGDSVLIINDELVNKWREELCSQQVS
jgi:hypothetical protein